jgi:hypothetical protein
MGLTDFFKKKEVEKAAEEKPDNAVSRPAQQGQASCGSM